MRVAFLGLGAMGAPLAGHLARHYETWVWNRTPSKAESHAQQYGTRAVSFEELGEAQVLLTCLPTSVDVDAIARQLLSSLRPGTLWIDHTSGEPELARATARLLAERGVDYLDAPLSGGVAGAQQGRVTVMVGGAPEVVERARPILQVYAAHLFHVGPLGSGHAVKAINNALLAANLWLLGEGLLALVGQGIDPLRALQAINVSSGRSNASENLFPERVLNRSFPLTFTLGLLDKDVRIARSVTQRSGPPAPVLGLIQEFYTLASRELGREVDHSAVVQLLERWAGREIRGSFEDPSEGSRG